LEGEEYVLMADEDFNAASATEQGKTIDITDFVDNDEIRCSRETCEASSARRSTTWRRS
jgi:hypothetical protein